VPQLRIGVGQADITPPVGSSMTGYIRREGTAQGVHTRLFAKSLYLNDGQSELVFICIDSLAVDQKLLGLVRTAVEQTTGLSGQNICLAATHTHSGPAGLAVLSFGGGHNDDLLTFTVPQIANSVQQAKESAFEAHLKIGSTVVEGVSQNRLDPAQPTGRDLHVLRIADRQGRLRAVWANYPCHPTFLGYDNTLFSADWPGVVCAVVEKVVGNDVVVMVTNGASGDIHPLFVEQTPLDLERMGQILGGAVISILGQLRATGHKLGAHNLLWGVKIETNPPCGRVVEQPAIQLLRRRVRLPFREYCTPAAYNQEIDRLCQQLAALGLDDSILKMIVENPGTTYPNAPVFEEPHFNLLARLNALAGERLERERVRQLSQGSPHQEIDLYLLRIDADLAILCFPGELSNQIGASIKARSGLRDLMIVTYANNYIGYLVSAKDYPEGGYDVGVSHFKPEAEAIVTEAALDLVAKSIPSPGDK